MMQLKHDKNDALLPLIEQAKMGKQAAMYELYDYYVQQIFRLAFSILLDKEDAEEVVQDTFIYAFRNINRFDPERSSLRTWLYTIGISRTRNKRRRKSLKFIRLSTDTENIPDNAPLPEQLVVRLDQYEMMHQALKQLSSKLREAIVLRYFGNMSYREMAAVLKCPEKTAESRVRLARKALYQIMQSNDDVFYEGIPGYE